MVASKGIIKSDDIQYFVRCTDVNGKMGRYQSWFACLPPIRRILMDGSGGMKL